MAYTKCKHRLKRSKMSAWKQYIKVISVGADDPASVNYDYDLCLQNSHDTMAFKVTIKVIYTLGSEQKTMFLQPKEQTYVCTVDGGPTFDNCEDVEILTVETVTD